MSNPNSDLETEADTMVQRDVDRGMLSVYVIMATIADEMGLVGEMRKAEFDDITAAMLAGEIVVYSRARRTALRTPLKALTMDDIAYVKEVRVWRARRASGAFGSPAVSKRSTPSGAVESRSDASPRQERKVSKKSPAKIAASARWEHLEQYKEQALMAANSKPFASRADAARHAADMLEDKPDTKGKRYDWTTVDGWLKAAGWSAKMSWAEWVALLGTVGVAGGSATDTAE